MAFLISWGLFLFHEPNEIHSHISDNKVSNNMLVISFTTNDQAMNFFNKKCFTLDKTSKTLLSLFLQEAKNALGKIPDKYEDKRNLNFSSSPIGSTQLLQCYLTEFLIRLMRNGDSFSEHISSNEESRTMASNSLIELIKEYMQKKDYEKYRITYFHSPFYYPKVFANAFTAVWMCSKSAPSANSGAAASGAVAKADTKIALGFASGLAMMPYGL